VSNENDRAEVSLVFNAAQSEQVRQLHDNQEGLAVFDPTLSRALRLAQEEETLAQHIMKGGVWVIPILFFGLFALIISLLKALQIWRLPEVEPLLAERLMKLDKIADAKERAKAQSGIVDQAKGLQHKLLQIIQQTSPGQIRDDRLFSALMDG